MFLRRRFYLLLSVVIVIIGTGYWFSPLFIIGQVLLCLFTLLVISEILVLYIKGGITSSRHCSERFSNGDDNEIRLSIKSSYPFTVQLDVTDEIPAIFQRRDILFHTQAHPAAREEITYRLRPVRRGVYSFGYIRIFVTTRIGCVERRFTCGKPHDVKVYPSFQMLHRYELLAISNRLTDLGIKRIRRVGHNTEFEQIKDYVQGDDFRTINWKASARTNQLKVNVYQDERSQQVFNIIDKGRVMQQSFRGMTLFDYAINASLVLSYVAMRREDKAGLCTFSNKVDTFIPAQRSPGHMQTLLESLYHQETDFGETDFSELVSNMKRHVTKRSLFILYTNFNGLITMQRQLSFLKQLSNQHRLLVVFFEDSEMKDYLSTSAANTEEYYQHVIAEKFAYEQRLIVSKLKQQGILSLFTTPENLSIDIINKYLEIKTVLS